MREGRESELAARSGREVRSQERVERDKKAKREKRAEEKALIDAIREVERERAESAQGGPTSSTAAGTGSWLQQLAAGFTGHKPKQGKSDSLSSLPDSPIEERGRDYSGSGGGGDDGSSASGG